ncbi:MAG: hypothetical protein IPG06_00400 [Haliea sp.]|nr:hypothetical protein [Haliea sp.]
MGEVARVGKMSRGSIYCYFSAKESLARGDNQASAGGVPQSHGSAVGERDEVGG